MKKQEYFPVAYQSHNFRETLREQIGPMATATDDAESDSEDTLTDNIKLFLMSFIAFFLAISAFIN